MMELIKGKAFFNNRTFNLARYSEKYLFLLIAFVGVASSFFFRTSLKNLPYQFGIDSIGLFIPPFLTGIYMFFSGFRNGFTNAVLVKAIILFAIQLMPLSDLLFRVVLPNPGEDFARNLAYARNMIANNTLWGGDKIAYPDEGYAFITQPGYRYFIALEMLLFKNLYRIVSVVNILFFIIALFFSLKSLSSSLTNSRFRLLLLFFLVFTIPYATKNILMGLSEWLMVSILMLSVYFFKVRNSTFIAIVLLALVPFIRQNTLPSVVILGFWIIYNSKNRLLAGFLFFIFLMLPFYHNLFYAGEWRFFVSIYHWPFLSYESPSKYIESSGINYSHITSNLLHYFGIHIRGNGHVDFLEEAFAFLFPFIFIYFFIQKKYFSGYLRILFLMITLGVIIPTIFFATDFYPRFEFVCVYFAVAAFLFLYQQKKTDFREK